MAGIIPWDSLLDDFAPHLFEQRHGEDSRCLMSRSWISVTIGVAAESRQCRIRGPCKIGEAVIGQFARCRKRGSDRRQDEVGEPDGPPSREGYGDRTEIEIPSQPAGEICCADAFNEVPRSRQKHQHDIEDRPGPHGRGHGRPMRQGRPTGFGGNRPRRGRPAGPDRRPKW